MPTAARATRRTTGGRAGGRTLHALAPPADGNVGVLRALTDLTSRAGFASKAGITFLGKRDTFSALGYARKLLPADYRQRYERNEIAARIVEAAPMATWRGDGDLVEVDNPDVVTAFEQAWRDLAGRLAVWPRLLRADILAGLGEYAVVLIGAPGRLEEELPPMRGHEDIAYLSGYAQEDAEIVAYELDSANPRYGQPVTYRLKRVGSQIASTPRDVHWTRIVHVAEGLLADDVFGQPRLRRVWNRLDDLEKVVGAGSEAFWQRVQEGVQFDLAKETALEPDEEKRIEEELDDFMHGMRRYFRTRGVTVKTFGSDVANFDRQAQSILTLISGGTGIPVRILTGSERGELASTQDRSNWNERIEDRRDRYAGPQVVRPLVDRLVQYGALPTPEQYEIRWPSMDALSETEKAEVAERLAGTNQKAGETVFTADEIRDRVYGWLPLEQVAPDEAAPDDGTPPEEPTDAMMDALRAMLRESRAVLDTPELRAALAAGDEEGAARLLAQGTADAAGRLRAPLLAALREGGA